MIWRTGAAVVAWGRYEELRSAEAEAGMQLLVSRVMPQLASVTSQPNHGVQPGRTKVSNIDLVTFPIRLVEKSGRFESRSADTGLTVHAGGMT